jgi:surfactin synthase thioesterase subunit
MATLTDHPAKWAPAFSFGNCLGFLQSCPVEVWVLFIAIMVSACLSLGTMIEHQHSRLDDRAMLSALLAAGGMPLIYSPSALCTSIRAPARFDEAALGALVQSQH